MASSKTTMVQLELPKPRTHGGARAGAGRPRTGTAGMPHVGRPELDRRHPVHVTLRVMRGLPSLRSRRLFGVVEGALRAGASRFGFSLVHYSVQGNHLHLIVEAEDKRALSRGMQGLSIRLARGINRALGRAGAIFGDRYHAHVLRTPTETRRALAYVINNGKKHLRQAGRAVSERWIDPCSTAGRFFADRKAGVTVHRGLRSARTWLLRIGWTLKGPITPATVPK